MNSLVIGYCICAKCGWTNNKFNWHTYFKCENCGSTEYVKEDLWGETENQQDGSGICSSMAAIADC